jgi:hypothetical protein
MTDGGRATGAVSRETGAVTQETGAVSQEIAAGSREMRAGGRAKATYRNANRSGGLRNGVRGAGKEQGVTHTHAEH